MGFTVKESVSLVLMVGTGEERADEGVGLLWKCDCVRQRGLPQELYAVRCGWWVFAWLD